jgi:hypothetical protein
MRVREAGVRAGVREQLIDMCIRSDVTRLEPIIVLVNEYSNDEVCC